MNDQYADPYDREPAPVPGPPPITIAALLAAAIEAHDLTNAPVYLRGAAILDFQALATPGAIAALCRHYMLEGAADGTVLESPAPPPASNWKPKPTPAAVAVRPKLPKIADLFTGLES